MSGSDAVVDHEPAPLVARHLREARVEPVFGLGVPELLILLLVVLGPVALVLAIVVVVDASGRPDAVWQATGQSKTMWIVLPIVLLLACGIGSLVASVVYLASIRPRLVRAG